MTVRVCSNCNTEKPLTEFEWQANRPSPRKTCKSCRYAMRNKEKENCRHREYQKERRKLFPDKVRESWEKAKYGVSKKDFNYQKCWICGATEKLCIDHCHTTNKPRGLLCSLCNTALGYFQDNVNKMERAITYLKDGPHFELPRKHYG